MSSSGNSRTNVDGRIFNNGPSRRQSLGGANNLPKISCNRIYPKRPTSSQLRSSLSSGTSTVLKHAKGTSRSFDGGSRSLDRGKFLGANGAVSRHSTSKSSMATIESVTEEKCNNWKEGSEEKSTAITIVGSEEDTVPGLLYDIIQKEVINLRRVCQEKDQSLMDKDDAIEVIYLNFHHPFVFSEG